MVIVGKAVRHFFAEYDAVFVGDECFRLEANVGCLRQDFLENPQRHEACKYRCIFAKLKFLIGVAFFFFVVRSEDVDDCIAVNFVIAQVLELNVEAQTVVICVRFDGFAGAMGIVEHPVRPFLGGFVQLCPGCVGSGA